MDDEQSFAFDDPRSDSDATVSGCSPVHLTPQVLGHHKMPWKCMHGTQRWRPSEPEGSCKVIPMCSIVR